MGRILSIIATARGPVISDSREFVIIRHGVTALNKDDKIRGWTNVPLSPDAYGAVRKLGKELKSSNIDYLISSDLTRALQTAQQISLESGIPIIATSENLRPWNVGEYTGKSAAKVTPLLKELAEDFPDEIIKNGESFNGFKYRCILSTIGFLNEYSDKVIAFVAHHRNDRLLRGWIESGCPDDLDIDFDHFFQEGIKPATMDVMNCSSPLFI